ncbi:MAG TPA: glycosyltransferase [Povalibacter sp.]|uniref:glycosyltransferase n=1 Tax=Povalibacter sp. TaxID=1962978 RepID=UPI002BA4C976|nr:glycosyltransferase [Povalibacter sp.]HMN42969.1 glycosyltransferase [Povalibacter sp.]
MLHVIDSGGLYGAERMLLDLVAEQLRSGMSAMVCSLGRVGEPTKPLERACAERRVPVVRTYVQSGISTTGAKDIAASARTIGANVLHTHGFKADCLVASLPRDTRGASVATLHGWTAQHWTSRAYWYRKIDLLALRRLDAVIAVTQAMVSKHCLDRQFGAMLGVVTNGIDVNFGPARTALEPHEHAALDFCRGGPTVCIVGRLSPEKGHALLLEAVARLRDGGAKLRALVIGAGALQAELQQHAVRLKLTEAVHFCGYVADPKPLMSACAALVSSSYSEGLPVSMLEAMVLQVPIVATAVGGVPDLLGHGRFGMLIPPADVAGLAEGLAAVEKGPQRLAALAAAANAMVHETYSAQRMAAGYQAVYELAQHRHAARAA